MADFANHGGHRPAASAAAGDVLPASCGQAAPVPGLPGSGDDYDRARVIHEAKLFAYASIAASFELGRRLLLLKQHEGHGAFCRLVTEEVGIPLRTAHRMMLFASKIGKVRPESMPALEPLGRTKLYHLLENCEPEDLDQLAQGVQVAGLTKDEIEGMTTRQLKEALRKQREKYAQDVATKDRVIRSKEAKVTELEEQLARRGVATTAEAEREQIELVRATVLQLEPLLQKLGAAAEEVLAQPATTAAETAARQAVEYVAQRLADIIESRGLAVDLLNPVAPPWLGDLTKT